MSSPKILVVEDEAIVALDIETRLNGLGYQVVGIADSGEGAITLAKLWNPDLALMDIGLKTSMDGIEAANQLRTRFNIPVIYLTSYTDDATLQRARVTEPLGYLIKPFEERELQSTIEIALYKGLMERRSQLQAARLHKIIATIPDGVALLNKEHQIEIANDKAQDFLRLLTSATAGNVVEQLGDLPIEKLLFPETPGKWIEAVVGDMPRRIFEATANPVSLFSEGENTDQNAAEWVLVIREVTTERSVQERVQLQNRLATVGQLSAGIAHDFNNLLAGIILNVQLSQGLSSDLPPKLSQYLESIYGQAQRASNLIRQILDFSRATTPQVQHFELIPVLREAGHMLQRMLPESIKLDLDFPEASCVVLGDPSRIQQVLLNLALNARDAMPNGGLLRVQVTPVLEQTRELIALKNHDRWVRITVSDNGIGIHQDIQPRIFDPFFTTKEPGKGTGLGLAQVYGIVQQHGGHITVDSQVNQGAIFCVYLPVQRASIPNLVASEREISVAAQKKELVILIAEDDANVRQSLSDVLELLNYRVLTASNGREALNIIEASGSRIDLVLSDMIMPEMGGMELVREIRRRRSDVKIILLTGYAPEETMMDFGEYEISDYLSKPIDLQHLSQSLARALRA